MGPLLVALAAILWATDSVVRYPLIQAGMDPTLIVFFEHVVGVLVLTPFIFWKHRRAVFKITPAQWTGLVALGAGASAFATVLFTASFKYVNPSVSILLQKLQPVFVVLLAMLFLRERPVRAFWIWAPVALFAGVAISFPTFHFSFLSEITPDSKGSLFALSAAAIWAIATVIGKGVMGKIPPTVVAYWRFVFGLITLGIMLAFAGADFTTITLPLHDSTLLKSFAYITLIPGFLALMLYYQGMMRTTATTTTFMELFFPITAVALNTIFLKTPLEPTQVGAAVILLIAVTRISLANRS